MSAERWLYKKLGRFDDPYVRPPLCSRKRYFGKELMSFQNDGHEVWLGVSDRWHYFYKHSTFTKMCLWYLAQRIFVDWFGLRTWIWFKLLSRQVRR